MSETAVYWAIKQKPERPIQKLVLIYVAFAYDERGGKSQLNIEFIKDQIQRTERTTNRALNALVLQGLISPVEGEKHCFAIPALSEA